MRPSPSSGTQSTSMFVNVPSLAEVWREERERRKELGLSTQLENGAVVGGDHYPMINPEHLHRIWEQHIQEMRRYDDVERKNIEDPHPHMSPVAVGQPAGESAEDLLDWLLAQANQPLPISQVDLLHEAAMPHLASPGSDEALTQSGEPLASQSKPLGQGFSQEEVRSHNDPHTSSP